MTYKPFKHLLALGTISFFLLTGNIAHAQSAAACPSGNDNDCPSTQICNPDTKLCMPENNDGLCSVGDTSCSCSTDDECRGNSTICNVTTHVCEYDPNATPQAGAGTTGGTGGSSGSGNFVSLTQLPTFQNITGQPSLTALFNNLYKICIGLAATLALIQIIIAGVMYMGGDSVTETRVARQKIGQAILGLVLVLSPVIVFGIINPSILSLTIGGLPQLGTPAPAASSGAGISSNITQGDTSAACKAQGGTATLICGNPKTNTPDPLQSGNTCPTGDILETTCGTIAGSTPSICSQYTNIDYGTMESNDSCTSGQVISTSCCPSAPQGGGILCCGIKK